LGASFRPYQGAQSQGRHAGNRTAAWPAGDGAGDGQGTFICLDAASSSEGDDAMSQYDSLPDHRQESPADGAFRRELARLLADRLKQLPEMQRKVLALYYFEDLRLREIAETFGLTESRICQIHAQAILAVKSYLQKFDPYFA
jgi:RNA polymerase sigma factor for flagellar operon FliA